MGALVPLPAVPDLPKMSPALRGWLLDDMDMEWLPPTSTRRAIRLPRYRDGGIEVQVEAELIFERYVSAGKPPSADFLHEWLRPLAIVVRNPIEADILGPMMAIFAAALATVPVGAFTRANWLRAMQTFKFWPSPADVAELLAEDAAEIRRAIEVLRFIRDETKP